MRGCVACRARGLFWLVSHTLAFLLRPSDAVAAALRAAEQQLGLRRARRPLLGVHLRRATPCAPYHVFGRRRSCTPLAEYAAKAHQLRQAYGLKTVLIVTDHHSQEAARNATAAFAPLTVLVRGPPPRAPSTGEAVGAGYDAALHFLVSAHLLGASDALVGKFSSHLARLAYSLMLAAPRAASAGGARGSDGQAVAAQTDCLRPYISLDQPWCFGRSCRKAGNAALKAAWRRALPKERRGAAAESALPPPPPRRRTAAAIARDERAAARRAAHERAVQLARLVLGGRVSAVE